MDIAKLIERFDSGRRVSYPPGHLNLGQLEVRVDLIRHLLILAKEQQETIRRLEERVESLEDGRSRGWEGVLDDEGDY